MNDQNIMNQQRFQIKQKIAFQEYEEEMVLIHPERQELLRTNNTGRLILRGIHEQQPVTKIADQLSSTFEVDQKRALNDVKTFVRELLENELIENAPDEN